MSRAPNHSAATIIDSRSKASCNERTGLHAAQGPADLPTLHENLVFPDGGIATACPDLPSGGAGASGFILNSLV